MLYGSQNFIILEIKEKINLVIEFINMSKKVIVKKVIIKKCEFFFRIIEDLIFVSPNSFLEVRARPLYNTKHLALNQEFAG